MAHNCDICGKFVGVGGFKVTAHDDEVLEAFCVEHVDCMSPSLHYHNKTIQTITQPSVNRSPENE